MPLVFKTEAGQQGVSFPDAREEIVYETPAQIAAMYGSQTGGLSKMAQRVADYVETSPMSSRAAQGAGVAFSGVPSVMELYNQQRIAEKLMNKVGTPVVDPRTDRIAGLLHQGLLGGTVYSGQNIPDYQGAYQNLVRGFYNQPEQERDVVLPKYDATANAKRCPDGYIFDEQLQACRLATTLPNQPEPTAYNFYQVPYEDEGLLGGYGANLFYG